MLLCALHLALLTPLTGLRPLSSLASGTPELPPPRRRGARTPVEVPQSWYEEADSPLRPTVEPTEQEETMRRPPASERRRTAEPVSFFSSGDKGGRYKTADDDLFLPPPPEEPMREGELGEGRYGDAGGGRTQGYWAALMEAPDRLRASDLNELLQPDHLDRLRFTNFPMQAYGALFKWEVLVHDAIELYRRPWAIVAAEHDLPPPDDDDVMRAVGACPHGYPPLVSLHSMHRHRPCIVFLSPRAGMRPERAIQQTFLWSDDWGFTQQLAFEHYEAKQKVVETFEFQPAEGAVEWLTILKEYQVPCCVCAGTSLDLSAARLALRTAGLDELVDEYVTAEDGCETAEQTYLVSCIKVKRPPERCVVFEDDQRGIISAHDASAKVVAVLGNSGRLGGDLRNADMRVTDLGDLSLMSLRELFKGSGPIP